MSKTCPHCGTEYNFGEPFIAHDSQCPKNPVRTDLVLLIEIIAQADTSGALSQVGNRGDSLRDTAKYMAKRYGMFPYWGE
jgi:hypothetical protein